MTRLARLKMSEEQFQNALVAALRANGFMVHFVPDRLYRKNFASKGDREDGRVTYAMDMGDPGFPDLTIVGCPDGVLFRELKVGRNNLTDNQIIWRDRLVASGEDWELWRDTQYDALLDTIRDRLLCRRPAKNRTDQPVAVPRGVSPGRRYTRKADRNGRTPRTRPELDTV